ncbi:hypothetical protein NMG60_11015988 [Bertholletia excelsa]
MGKVAAAEMMKKKKKGRPSLLDLRKRNLKQQQEEEQQGDLTSNPNFNPSNRRSTRRNPNLNGVSPSSDWISGDDDDDDDERKEKKVKLVVRLPPSNHHYLQPRSSANSLSLNSASHGSDSNAEGEIPKINAAGDRSGDFASADQVEKVQKATDTLHGSQMESGPTTPLPDKKLLVFILDRLQKKDTYGVFSEPVDPDELPDYHEIIEHPMDFGTVRRKLDEGHYSNLDEFEADVFLICSNAMQYNAPDTIYFRQARSIQELAKRDFENLRQVNDEGEPQPKIVRRGRPPSKNLKKSVGNSPSERAAPEISPDTTPATGGDSAGGSNSYNLRKTPISFRLQATDALFRASYQTRHNETYGDLSEWNNEFPASVLKAEAKHTKRLFSCDENKRASYKQSLHSAFAHEPSTSSTLNFEMKQLMEVGLRAEHGYARSLARFAANLGPVVWKIASKKIENSLPSGVKFGPGWVGENDISQPAPSISPSTLPEQKRSNQHEFGSASTSGTNPVVTYRDVNQAISGQNSSSQLAVFKGGGGVGGGGGTTSGPSIQAQLKQMLYPDQNGFNGLLGCDPSSQTGMLRVRSNIPTGQPNLEEVSVPSQMVGMVSRSSTSVTPPMAPNKTVSEPGFSEISRSTHHEYALGSSRMLPEAAVCPIQRQYSLPVPPDLNVRFQAPGSPSSSIQIGSPQQPDLALQL